MGKTLGERILNLIKKNKLSRKDVCARACVSDSQLSRYISDDREPSPDILANIALALGTTSDYLLGIESNDTLNVNKTVRLLARNSQSLTEDEKKALLDALLWGN